LYSRSENNLINY